MTKKTNQVEIISEDKEVVIFQNTSRILNIPSGAMQVQNEASLLQKKIWFELIYKAFPQMSNQRYFTISVKELKEKLGWDNSNSDDLIKEALHALTGHAVQWNIFGKDKSEVWESFSLLASCSIPKNTGICTYEFSGLLQRKFLAMGEEMYAKIDLIISNKFQSKYALAFYCLGLDYLILKYNYGEKNLQLKELRKFLGLKDHEYKLIGDFNRWIIKTSEKEINTNSDMDIQILPVKEQGKKIGGYKICMSLKEERLKKYLLRKNDFLEKTDGQLTIFEQIDSKKSFKKDLVAINNQSLKKFFSKHNISITTDTIQEKLKEITSLFGEENREDYLLFLMKYTEKEVTKGSIKNIAGFFVKLLTDDVQTENYLINLEEQQQKIEKRKIQIESRINAKLQEKYQLENKKLFQNYVVENIIRLEEVFIKLVKTHITSGFAYDIVIKGQNKGIIDKTLITNQKPHTRLFILQALEPYQKELGYKNISFEDWKAHTVNDAYLKSLRTEIEKELS